MNDKVSKAYSHFDQNWSQKAGVAENNTQLSNYQSFPCTSKLGTANRKGQAQNKDGTDYTQLYSGTTIRIRSEVRNTVK